MKEYKNNTIKLDEDSRLMWLSSRGDRKAFDTIYHIYYPVIISYLIKNNGCISSCEDLAQTVFLCIWEQKSLFRAQSNAKTYILGIAKNVLNEYHRQYQKEKAIPDIFEIASENNDAEKQEILDTVRHAKSQLSDKQQQALDITLNSNLNPKEAARILGCPENIFRQRLYDAKKRLQTLLWDFLKDF
ncbi:MAG: RNA polymerase sigma factor [Planctomycetota bacterium]